MALDPEKSREARLRRMARRQGYLLRKSRRRNPQARDYGKWFVVEAERNLLVSDTDGWDLDQVEEWLTMEQRSS